MENIQSVVDKLDSEDIREVKNRDISLLGFWVGEIGVDYLPLASILTDLTSTYCLQRFRISL